MDDIISRQAAIDALKHNQDVYSHNFHDDPIDKYTTAIIAVDIDSLVKLPSAQPERKNGHWEMVPDPYGFFDEIPVCSECGCTTEMRKTYKFCPNCGADMRGEQNESV